MLFVRTHLFANWRQIRQIIFLRQIQSQIILILPHGSSIRIRRLSRDVVIIIIRLLQFQYILLNHLTVDIETKVQEILPLVVDHTALLLDYRMHRYVSINQIRGIRQRGNLLQLIQRLTLCIILRSLLTCPHFHPIQFIEKHLPTFMIKILMTIIIIDVFVEM